MSTFPNAIEPLLIGSARIDLLNVQIRQDVLLDELHLEGGDIRIDSASAVSEGQVTTGETRIRAMMCEANLNRVIAANMPADSTVRNLHIALMSGRARISGKAMVTFVPIPFSIDAAPIVHNGVRVTLDCRNATLGVNLPRAVVDIIQERVNDALGLDLSDLEIPIFIDEIRCEPGRLTALGRAKITWPPHTPLVPAANGDRRFGSSVFAGSKTAIEAEVEPSRHTIGEAQRKLSADDTAPVS